MAESQVQRIMEGLKVSEAEAKAILAEDKQIDRGERMDFDLSPEKEKIAKKYAKSGTRKPTVYNFNARKRKPNLTKSGIIEELFDFLQKSEVNTYTEVEITNKERQIAFTCGENKYELTLVQKRKPKG